MSEDQTAVKIEYRDGRLCAVRVGELPSRAHDRSVDIVAGVLDLVLKCWSEHHPRGYAVPCWEEAVRDTLHWVYYHPEQEHEQEISLAPLGRVFVRSTASDERSSLRILSPSAVLGGGLGHGSPHSFFYRHTRQEMEEFVYNSGRSLEVIRPVSTADIPGTPWIQIEGSVSRCRSVTPFRSLARFQYDVLAQPEHKRAIFGDHELYIHDGPSRAHHGLLALHGAFTEVTMPILRFESLLRVMDILGITPQSIFAYHSSERPLILKMGEGLDDVIRVNHPLRGRLAWDSEPKEFGFFLGSEAELTERHTFHTLWEKYGLPDMKLDTYLRLRRPRD